MTSRTDVIQVFAPAKINLFLHVGEKRADGFHALESLVAFADVGDMLELAPAPELTLQPSPSRWYPLQWYSHRDGLRRWDWSRSHA